MTLRSLRAIVLGLLLVILGGCDEAPSTRQGWLLLELSPTRDFRETYTLSVKTDPQGAVWEGVISIPGRASYTRQRLSRQQLRQFREQLLNNGIDSLTSTSESREAEAEVLYTRLEVHWGTFHNCTLWRGLDTAQSRIASVFLDGPMGENVARGLAAVRQRKQ